MEALFATGRLQDLYPAIQSFIEDKVIPLEKEFLSMPFGELVPKLDALREQVKANGWWAPPLPEAEGPMKARPAASTFSTKSGFSDRKP